MQERMDLIFFFIYYASSQVAYRLFPHLLPFTSECKTPGKYQGLLCVYQERMGTDCR